MNFITPAVLWALPAVVLCCMMYWLYGDTMRHKLLKKFSVGKAKTVLSPQKRFMRRTFLLFSILFLIVAAARPYWGERPLEFNLAQTDALIVFDVSKSMLAEDVAPSRLEHLQRAYFWIHQTRSMHPVYETMGVFTVSDQIPRNSKVGYMPVWTEYCTHKMKTIL